MNQDYMRSIVTVLKNSRVFVGKFVAFLVLEIDQPHVFFCLFVWGDYKLTSKKRNHLYELMLLLLNHEHPTILMNQGFIYSER